jgi:hypothetical protein
MLQSLLKPQIDILAIQSGHKLGIDGLFCLINVFDEKSIVLESCKLYHQFTPY